jgi:Zn-dependent protease
MQNNWRIGTIFGIPLFINSSWLIILALMTYSNSITYQQWGVWQSWVAGLAIALLLFGSVLLHELGHSLVALSQNIQVNSITLFLFGGIAAIAEEPKTPGKAFQVAIAGPLVSFGLFITLGLVAEIFPKDSLFNEALASLANINLILAMFNMIPGLPLDGGQVLRAIVWKITGNPFTGVRWAAKTGQTLGWLAITLGVYNAFINGNYGSLWLALLGWFALTNASAYDRFSQYQEALLKIKAGEIMTREFRVVEANLTLQQFANQYLTENNRYPAYFASSDGRYRGLVSLDALRFIERSYWDKETLNMIITPMADLPAVRENTDLVDVILAMENTEQKLMTVLSPADAVAGIIDRGDIVKAIAQFLKMPISATEIQRIKDEGAYPPNLNLGAIANMARRTSGKPEN